MKNPKLIDGLRMLEKEEWISFRKYVLMYCTKSSDNYRLLDYLFTIRNSLVDDLEMEHIKKPLFEKMTVKNFSNLMSRIFGWFEEWLVWYDNKKDLEYRDVQLVKIYNRNGIFNLADTTFKRVEKRIKGTGQLDLRKHKNLHQLYHYHYFSDNPVKYKRKEGILKTLIAFYTLQIKEQTLLYLTELHNWGVIQNHDYSKEVELLKVMTSLISDSRASQVLQLIYTLVKDLDTESFFELRSVITEGEILEDSELFMLASLYMITFSLRLWNNNKISNPQIIFDAYDFGLESKVLLKTGKIPFIRFINLVTTLGYIKTSEKTYGFIDKWKHLVAGENQEAVHALAYAQLKFFEKKYDELIPLLLGVKYNSDRGKLRGMSLDLIGLYADRKNNYSLLSNRIHNFKRVLKTYGTKESNLTYRSLLNFAKVLELLVKRDFAKINIQIDNYSPLIYKRWLENEIKAGKQ